MEKSELDLKSKLYQKSVIDRIKKIDFEEGSEAPFVVELDPTTQCNLDCLGCISEDILDNNRFSSERLMELGRELVKAGVKAIVLIGGGEPLSHPKIGDLIEFFGENDVKIGLTTNGILIDKYIDVIAKYCSWTRVSVDAATDEMYQYLRPDKNGNSKFNKVISNMEMLAEKKNGILGYSFLIRTSEDGPNFERSNISEVKKAAKLAKDIGCDYFEIKPSYNMDHFLIMHDEEKMKQLKTEIKEGYKLEEDGFKILESVNLEYAIDNELNIQLKDYHECPISELRTLVTPSGAYVCPYFRGRKDKCIGRVNNTSFSDMWNGGQREEVMKELDPKEDCKMHCIRHKSNLILFKMQKSMENIEAIDDFNLFI
ncbi:radical SAM protein [Halanaerobacter jeridensis]|uniref:MoaA/NifB/PqqE/SkfB family radical SAM enzyme n=1 Tax=Halanaerobacter jeridensis TaxID=706427 RepID=A0A939BPN0_9FIRM|nr:radical SAM protein [Halanaerobacter jeridensis]MBM7557272.1 MoaA/NifB/PqqE/SkfB family radical SAM enzyme [Halanaerobacter jeridensis]